ncbi:alkaline shock response membrane anchor protein AmaP [Kutzneria chonburiensis]|uniref:Alkaline shock response membrane anchor protein AmaP n=1 Tax=Kutzneria chonburiensis TaxID=1483604 RepID=A0ABV6N0V7_9PSEU|nr:alkaline shock response membrane anchor protein AmaP [Kutzneria chonburiensis]
MTGMNRPARLNRFLLALIGLVLLAAGGFAVAAHYGRLRIVERQAGVLYTADTPATGVLLAAGGVAVVIGLLSLRWLFAQLSRAPKAGVWRLEGDDGVSRFASNVATTPFCGEIEAYPGVRAARAVLAGTMAAPRMMVVVIAGQDADVTDIRQRLETEGLPRLREALDLDILPASVEFRFTTTA